MQNEIEKKMQEKAMPFYPTGQLKRNPVLTGGDTHQIYNSIDNIHYSGSPNPGDLLLTDTTNGNKLSLKV